MGEGAGESRPKLVAVTSDVDSASGGAPAGGETRSKLPLIAGILAAALLVSAVGWILSERESTRLESRLGGVEAELGRTRGELSQAQNRLAAFQGHVDAARERLSALAGQIGALDRFLASDPAGGESQAPPEPAPLP